MKSTCLILLLLTTSWCAAQQMVFQSFQSNAKPADVHYLNQNQITNSGANQTRKSISVYFNRELSKVSFKSNTTLRKISIYPLMGGNPIQFKGSTEIDISTLPSGNYLLVVEGDDIIYTKRIIK